MPIETDKRQRRSSELTLDEAIIAAREWQKNGEAVIPYEIITVLLEFAEAHNVPAPVPAEGVEGQSVLNATMRKYDAWIERDGSSIFIFASSTNFTKRTPYYKDGVTQPYNLLSIRIQNDNYELPDETVEQIATEIESRLDAYSANQAERKVAGQLAKALQMHMQWIGPAPKDVHSYDSLREDAWKLGTKALAAFNQLRRGGE